MSRESWWIEFLENEVDPSLRQDMEKLLEKSGKDRATLDAMANLRQWIADSDPVQDLWSDEKAKELKAKIEKAIDQQPPVKAPKRKPSNRKRVSSSSPDFVSKRQAL